MKLPLKNIKIHHIIRQLNKDLKYEVSWIYLHHNDPNTCAFPTILESFFSFIKLQTAQHLDTNTVST